jgi:hypothetical protein
MVKVESSSRLALTAKRNACIPVTNKIVSSPLDVHPTIRLVGGTQFPYVLE